VAKTIIKNIDWVITVDEGRRVISDGAIAFTDSGLTFVGKTSDLGSEDGAEIVDGRGLLAVPGLIDTSVAVAQQLGRGLGDLCDLPKYRLERVFGYEAALTSDDARWAARHCILEMIRAGTTTFVDTGSRFPAEIAEVSKEMGVRGVVGRACQDIFETAMGECPSDLARETVGEVIARAEKWIKAARIAGGLITPCIAIPWLAGCSQDLGAALADLAKREGVIIVVSAAASRDEAVMSRMSYGQTEVERVAQMDLLGKGTIVSHAGWTGPSDLPLLQRSRATVACCPSMSHRLGTGALEYGRYPELLAFGANVTLGSGSAMASNFVDVARQLYLFSGGNKTFRLDATATRPEAAVEMATVRAAEALGRPDLGSLEAGKKADITLFRCTTADWVPLIHPIQNLAFSSRGGADTVIVDGRILLKHGKLASCDETEILAQSQTRAEALAERSNLARFAQPSWTVVA